VLPRRTVAGSAASSRRSPKKRVAVPFRTPVYRREWVATPRDHRIQPPIEKKHYRYWELTGEILYCGECGRRMIGHSSTNARSGLRHAGTLLRVPDKGLDHKHACKNKGHRAEPLGQRIAEPSPSSSRTPPGWRQQAKERIERER
jgi:hypothetical protein